MSENLVTTAVEDTAKKPFAIHLLDVGLKEYGDSLLCQFGDVSVLIDGAHTGDQTGKGGHKSIPDQIAEIFGSEDTPYKVTLLIVTHAHEDHIGCLPYLVDKGILTADYALVADPQLGWGRAQDDMGGDSVADERIRQVSASLREEIRTKGTDDQTLAEFLADAVGLEDRYNRMLDTLEQNGTKVIRYGRDKHTGLVTFLKNLGVELSILGPSRDQLAVCAERIAAIGRDTLSHVSDSLRSDTSQSAAELYRQIVGDGLDAMDAKQRPGPAINLQSIVTCFKYGGKKFLFAGDMQFVQPQMDGVDEMITALRNEVKNAGPYTFAKLSHHGSFNAFSEEIYEELNANGETSIFGICAGEQSTAHPNPSTLEVLYKYRNDIWWARTDHNRQSTFFFENAELSYELEKGKINDPKPNATDEPASGRTMPGAIAPTPGMKPEKAEVHRPAIVQQEATNLPSTPNFVEVIAKVPHVSTRVTLTIDVEPGAGTSLPTRSGGEHADPTPQRPLQIAGGRKLPDILFVTSKDALAKNIGQKECDQVLWSLRSGGFNLYDGLPDGVGEAAIASKLIRERLQQYPQIKGVVLLGGYDVVPSQRLDCLPPDLRAKVSGNTDADNFIIWSDDVYGDMEGDGLPEIPVSRVPDGNKAELVFAAIQAVNEGVGSPRIGIRNINRPFAAQIYKNLPGTGEMLISRPVTYSTDPRYSLSADRIYIMLHGDYTDSSRFWGEETDENQEAVNVSNLPRRSGPVVFTGCCWGALTVNTPAGRVANGRSFGQKSPEDSLAMSFLLRGATAFIGCTGSHYSPMEWPYRFFGGPMHDAFWRLYKPGGSPAQALFDAKLQYLKGMPHGQTSAVSKAIEYKILRQYTCLGLGW